MNNKDEWYTPRSLAEKLHVSRMTIYRALMDGTLESDQVRGSHRIRQSAVDRWLWNCKQIKQQKQSQKDLS